MHPMPGPDACLAALARAHIGFPKLVGAVGPKLRVVLIVVREAVIVVFFLVVAWAGWRVLLVLEGTNLVSLPWIPTRLTQSVIPVGAVLFIAAEALSFFSVQESGESEGGGDES